MLRRFFVAFFVMLILAFVLHSFVRGVHAEESRAEQTPALSPLPALSTPTPQEILPDDEMEYFVHFAVYSNGILCVEQDTTLVTSRALQSADLPNLKGYLRTKIEAPCTTGTIVIRFITRVPIL